MIYVLFSQYFIHSNKAKLNECQLVPEVFSPDSLLKYPTCYEYIKKKKGEGLEVFIFASAIACVKVVLFLLLSDKCNVTSCYAVSGNMSCLQHWGRMSPQIMLYFGFPIL